MLLNIRVAGLSRRSVGARVYQWLVEPGQRIEFGDDLVLMERHSSVVLHRAQSAASLFEGGELRDLGGNDVAGEATTSMLYVVRCLDAGFLAEVRAPVDTPISDGDVLGVLATQSDEPVVGEVFTDARVDVEPVQRSAGGLGGLGT